MPVPDILLRFFRAYGQVCASRPWEVIIGTMTVTLCIMSMSLFAGNEKDTNSADVFVLTLTRCLAVVYFYVQFSNLRRLGSKYLLGIAGLFTVFSSFVFSIGVVKIFGSDLTGLNEALPFFLLLVDLSRACTLAKFALSARSQDEVIDNIGRGMELLGPVLTLDALVETLVIGVGTLSGVKILETMCCFGCLSVVANFIAFMTFYPACLALIYELSTGTRPFIHIQKLSRVWQLTEEEKPNPVTQRVKIIMSAGLMFVHIHSRFLPDVDSSDAKNKSSIFAHNNDVPVLHEDIVPDIPLWQFHLHRLCSMSADYVFTFFLATVLTIKYVFFDQDPANEPFQNVPPDAMLSLWNNTSDIAAGSNHSSMQFTETQGSVSTSGNDVNTAVDESIQPTQATCEVVSSQTETKRRRLKSATFHIGEESSEDSDADDKNKDASCMKMMSSVETQTESQQMADDKIELRPPRSVQECAAILKSEDGAAHLTDEELISLVNSRQIASYQLENVLGDHGRAVGIRRQLMQQSLPNKLTFDNLPYLNYDYKYVHGSCCENVVGHLPVPVGVVQPLLLDGQRYTVPMATTEGCLVASTNRGCRVLELAGGVSSVIVKDGMTRAPVVRFDRVKRADEVRRWLEQPANYNTLAEAFNSTSRYAKLVGINTKQVSRTLHLRFTATTGDAMGMNMISKGCEKVLNVLRDVFPDMKILSLSGNFCTDKKPSAVNWVEGRGKSVICDAVIPARVVHDVLKTSAAALVDLNVVKNLQGSAVAGSIGGFNAHAANVVTAIYIATGQDAAENVCSSNCMTVMETTGPLNEDLYISCTMPSIEVGTVGGGTVLPPQAACLEMLGVRGSNNDEPGANARLLARIICATVMAAELSLMSALTTGDLVKSHLKHNRSVLNMASADNNSSPTKRVSCISTSCSAIAVSTNNS